MANSNNPLSSISYTNKDFRAIFNELLDLTKKLTYKWDPSISNESDPGVILLKLNAIIGDKNNYNIDKNILEAFPETVTQEVSARNMYKQLAYIMPWYRSATTTVTFKWVGEAFTPEDKITIPRFTMLTDSEQLKIYTLIEDVEFKYGVSVSSGKVVQGTITDLIINGDTTLTLDNIDYNNRIYLNDYSVAENGIFISNAEEQNLGYWEKVDNLQVVPRGERYYEFGVDTRSNSTYVELPSDIETLIRAGLNIKYVISDGISGNVNANEIIKFYQDVSVQFRGESLNLNEEVIKMYNPSATKDGSDPEPVSQAYNSYKKVAGTFDTLVTLRDYINAIYQSGYVSNDLVSDRLTDIQSSYKIITDKVGSSDTIIEYGRFNDSTTNDLSPYDLKLYLLHNSGVVSNITDFNATFDLEPSQSDTVKQVENYLTSTRCMQHNFEDIIPNKPCMFRNIYPIKIRFVPQYQLSNVQIDSVKRNIIQSLYDTLNSRQVNFGEAPNYNLIYDAIMNSDERIKIITIDDFTYTTYATYWDDESNKFKSIPVSEFNDPWIITVNNKSDISTVVKDLVNPSQYIFIAKEEKNTVYKYNITKQIAEEYSKFIDAFRIDIITRAVLAGVTPLYNQESTFQYSIDQVFDHVDNDVERVSTDLVVSPWGFDENGMPKEFDKDTTDTIMQYTLRDNESIQFLAPSFITEMNYSNYVKFEMCFAKRSNEYEYRVANPYNYSKSEGTYSGAAITLSIALNNGGYEDYVDLSDTVNDKDHGYIPGKQCGSLAWFTNGVVEYQGNHGNILRSSPLEKWSREYEVLYTQEEVYRINPDTDYKLKAGDAITFFWKEEDDDTAPYRYRCYKGIENETETSKSPIIRGTFTINGVHISTAKVNPNSLLDSGTIPYDVNPYSNYQKIYGMYGDNTLSGTKSIDTRKLNQVQLKKNERYFYFITNNIVEDENTNQSRYVMKFDVLPNFTPGVYYDSNENIINTKPDEWGYGNSSFYTKTKEKIQFVYDYTLKSDEYFIYANKSMTEYEILGTGTLIRLFENPFGDSLPVFEVEAVSYEDVAMQGLSSFTDKTKLLSVDALIKEQQIFNLTAGDSVSIKITDEFTGMPYSLVSWNEQEGNLVSTTHEGIAFPFFCTNQSNSTKGLNIEYSTGDAGYSPLPGIEIEDESSNWAGTAILNIDSTYDDAQIINNTIPSGSTSAKDKKSLQQMIIRRLNTNSTGNEEETIANKLYPVNPFNSNNELNVLTNVSLTKVGGSNIDVTYLDAYGERANISFYAFELNPAFNAQPLFNTTPEYGIRMNFKTKGIGDLPNITQSASGPNTVFKISGMKLEQGYNYILGIRNTSASQKFWLMYGYGQSEYVTCLNASSNNSNQNASGKGLGNGKYYFLLDNITNNITALQIKISGEDEQGFLEFDNLTKCVKNDLFVNKYGINPSDIESQLPKYDYNGYFKYNYSIPKDIIIEDPLEAKKFFDENHPCNKATIGHVNLIIPSEASRNVNASSIDVMNNDR